MEPIKVVILGAAGRDFHNFNVYYRNNSNYRVVAFTATQIPNIEGRLYPPELAGPHYPEGIPILPEEDLPKIIKEKGVQEVVFSYSDVTHEHVMHLASLAIAQDANFVLLGADQTMIKANRPVIAITAVRTGVGKSQTSRYISNLLREMGKKVVAIRHPMPYGNLVKQRVQRFATLEDLDRHECTIEEREEYEPHIANGFVVYAGVDYQAILKEAEKEGEVILWDGGNNDLPFFKPDLHLCLVDPHRPGHELLYHPGEANFRRADVLIINKVDTASPEKIAMVEENCRKYNPKAQIIKTRSPFQLSDGQAIQGKRVVVVEDGPTLTHGEMAYGAGYLAAKQGGAREIVSPLPYAVDSIQETYHKYPHCKDVLPAMGYGKEQMEDLQETLNRVPADLVIVGTPVDLRYLIKINKPAIRVRYELEEIQPGQLKACVQKVVS